MLITNFYTIGERLWRVRLKASMTREEVAELADISDRTYADIERGTVKMRVDTLLKICDALKITPDEILTEKSPRILQREEELLAELTRLPEKEKSTALELIKVYMNSLQ